MNMSFDTTTRKKTADEENKRQLVESIETENQRLKELLDHFYAQERRNEQNYAEINETILQAIDKLLAAGDWEGSLFLRNAAKPLRQAREEIIKIQQKLQAPADKQYIAPIVGEDMMVVYVSLYQSNGFDLAGWERQLQSLTSYTQGRPIYQNEDEINRAIRARLVPTSEAYIKVAIKKAAILTGLKQLNDKLNQPLLNVSEGAILPTNILEFVHAAKHYIFIGGRLIAK
jgi:intracellular multiplication protein IcmQ